MTLPVIALLGRKDQPTDAVEEYCRYLGSALQAHDIQLQIHRVPWELHGWRDSLHALQLQAANWRATWVLVQYTALAWSPRGFPFRFHRVLNILKSSGARVGVVYHDVEPYSSARLVDKLRRIAQTRVMRHALKLADLAVFTVPLYKLSWLPFVPTNALYTDPYAPSNRKISTDSYERHVLKMSKQAFERFEARNKVADNPSPTLQRCHFIPVGPNLPIAEVATPRKHPSEVPTVGVFSITGGEQGTRETETIVMAAKSVCKKLGRIRLLVFGRHAEIREASLRRGLQNTEVELSVEGLLAPTEIVARIRSCDILFFVRGGISTRRSSAIAGIACGVPMVAFVGPETSWPFPDAGVVLVSPDHPKELIDAANLLLTNTEFREGMALANCIVYQEHFSWVTIAHRYAAVLSKA